MSRLNILFVGDARYAEFQEPLDLVRETAHLTCCDVRSLSAFGQIPPDADFDLILLGIMHPGSLAEYDLAALRWQFPVTPRMALVGTWCQGETRAGTALPGAMRIYCDQWRSFWDAQTARHRRGLAPLWSQPPTATEEELVLCQTAAIDLPGSRAALDCRHAELRSLLLALLRRNKWFVQPIADFKSRLETPCDVGIWDAALVDEMAIESLRQFSALIAPAPVLALVAFLRVEDRARLLDWGAAAIMPKPFIANELMAELSRITGRDAVEATAI